MKSTSDLLKTKLARFVSGQSSQGKVKRKPLCSGGSGGLKREHNQHGNAGRMSKPVPGVHTGPQELVLCTSL